MPVTNFYAAMATDIAASTILPLPKNESSVAHGLSYFSTRSFNFETNLIAKQCKYFKTKQMTEICSTRARSSSLPTAVPPSCAPSTYAANLI